MSEPLGDPIAQNDLGEAVPCDCGGVNLVMGAVTHHFAPEEVKQLHELVAEALAHVGRDLPPPLPPTGPKTEPSFH